LIKGAKTAEKILKVPGADEVFSRLSPEQIQKLEQIKQLQKAGDRNKAGQLLQQISAEVVNDADLDRALLLLDRVESPATTPETNKNRQIGETETLTPGTNKNDLVETDTPKTETNREIESTASKDPQISDSQTIKSDIEQKDLLNHPDRKPDLESVLIGSEKVPVFVDNTLRGNTVEVHYKKAENGLVDVDSIYVKAGPKATKIDIMLHARTVARMKRYAGLLGRAIRLKNQLLDLFFNIKNPEIASRAWEAKLEVEKLEEIIDFYMQQRSKGIDTRPDEEFIAEIDNLEAQLQQHRKTYEELDNSEGVGSIAARGNKTPDQMIDETLTVLKEIEASLGNKKQNGAFKPGEKPYLTSEDMREVFIKTQGQNFETEKQLKKGFEKFKERIEDNFNKHLNDVSIDKVGTGKKAKWIIDWQGKTLSDVEIDAEQRIEKIKKDRIEKEQNAPEKITVKPEGKQRINIFQQYNISPQKLRSLINKISDKLLNNKEVEGAVERVNKGQAGTKSQPNQIDSGIDLLAIIKYYQDGSHGALENRNRYYQFGSDPNTILREELDVDRKTRKIKPNTNARVQISGDAGGAYNPGIINLIENIKQQTNLNDRDIADAMITLVSEGKIPEGLKDNLRPEQKKQLAEITYLIFGRESVRNQRNLVHSSLLFSQVVQGNKSLINVIDELPMSPDLAAETSRLIDDIDLKQKYPAGDSDRAKRVEKMEELETKAINDFIVDRINQEKINISSKEELLDYSDTKLKKLISDIYEIKLD
ncbi:MAG: hypothetical protein ACFBSE_18345, partial [Prochloraceae cyanobacterium]